ncbi:ABC transporter ATP-binding protein [Microlunatus soli]|uniref:Peptide/nickel transport system ATP-binding protein n=1 Tax=Microlunatus soli TaxID=630515 RepID=A0A1H1MVN1_9ACTN|nr:ABC transporter ATP-binding protein [Microlunatus soli]SDR90672.1 peptide/nickel transport system ATP-binding protein [Microlunatus soli]
MAATSVATVATHDHQPTTADRTESSVLAVTDLTTEFRTRRGPVRAVNGISFDVARRGVLAVIGESGSGKSAMLRSLIGINPPSTAITGRISLQGKDLLSLPAKQRRRIRGRDIAMVFQDPLTALDPVYTIGRQLTETVGKQQPELTREQTRRRALELLELVQIPSASTRLKAYPNELSGGMRQRVVIAMAIAGRPQVLLADEPTTALDVTVQAKMMRLFGEIQAEIGMAMIVVTHDLGVAAELADDVAVMYAGRFVEQGSAVDVLSRPRHPYTEGLIEANVRAGQGNRPLAIPGTPPSLTRLPPGCAFAPRCRYAVGACWEGAAPINGTVQHWSRCLLADGAA